MFSLWLAVAHYDHDEVSRFTRYSSKSRPNKRLSRLVRNFCPGLTKQRKEEIVVAQLIKSNIAHQGIEKRDSAASNEFNTGP